MKKLLAVAAIVGPALMFVPAAPASASSVCLPITIDGQPVCQDTTPVDQALAQAESELQSALATVLGTVSFAANDAAGDATICPRIQPQPNGAKVYVPVSYDGSAGSDLCLGYEISIAVSTSGQPVHVPQVCLTTTGTCVGPIDETLPVPDGAQSPLELCVQPMFWEKPAGSTGGWSDYPIVGDPLWVSPGCVAVPPL